MKCLNLYHGYLDRITISQTKSKRKLREEFDKFFFMEFEEKGHDIFVRWYVDGRIYFHKVIDTAKPKRRVYRIQIIDSGKIKKVREVGKRRYWPQKK